MRVLKSIKAAAIAALTLTASGAQAQSVTNLKALRGLAPVSALDNSEVGKAALAANLTVTRRIQEGSARQPILLPFRQQQQQALRDAFITGGNASELADGLGSKLGGVYQSLASYSSADDGKTIRFSNVSPAIAQLIAFASGIERSDSESGKYFFANATVDGKAPVSAEASAILREVNGVSDIFGQAYHLPAGGEGADQFGNSRPFQTEPHLLTFESKDFFGVPSGNIAYLRGSTQDLTNSPSYPSGHSAYGYTEALLLALLVPERYPQMMARAAEYGNDRIVLGAHYAMDVLGGRTLATYDVAQLLASKPGYVGVERGGVQIDDFKMPRASHSMRPTGSKSFCASGERSAVL